MMHRSAARGARACAVQGVRHGSSWTNTPYKPSDDRLPRYTTGPRAGELYGASSEETMAFVDILSQRLQGKTKEVRTRQREEDYIQQTMRHSELMRAELLGEDRHEVRKRHLQLWFIPMGGLCLGLFYFIFEPSFNHHADRRMRHEEKTKFLEVVDKMETFKIDATVERIHEIEAELRRRGVKVPE